MQEFWREYSPAVIFSIVLHGALVAAVILLRGLGRLDVFPMNDSSVARNLTLVTRAMPFDVVATLEALGAQRGMLYYHLLLARLEARDEVGRASGSAAIGQGIDKRRGTR